LSKFSRSYALQLFNNGIKYFDCLKNPQGVSAIPAGTRGNALKAMVNLAKYLGQYEEYKTKLSNCGVKWERSNGLGAFLRIFNASNNDVIKWYHKARSKLRENEALFTKFLLHSGLRTSEAIHSFNLTIKLSKEHKLSEYYDSELQVLCHFKYPKLFIRRTKNCYITFIQPEFLSEIVQSKPVTYSMIRKRLERKSMQLRFNELRDKFGTYLLGHGILEAEINLCQGRIPVDIFIRHYWSPKLKELFLFT
jgi:intergrase/recombinase